ncbi:MAG: endonuclease/exonuclease/phosphatase family protein [Planctomycetota bacterium]
MKVLSWNILHGGGRRLPWIALEVLDEAPDVVCLTEYRNGIGGGQLRGVLADHGLCYQHATDAARGRNGILVAARMPIGTLNEASPKLVTLELPEAGLALTAAHLPDARRGDLKAETRKSAAWHAVLDEARARRGGYHAVLGDFNTGRHRIDEDGTTFTCTALMGQLRTLGYLDSWADRPERPLCDPRAVTWTSHTGAGFRLDHTWCSPPLAARVRGVDYRHGPRLRGLSDHSAMVVELSEPSKNSEFGGPLATPTQKTL